MIRTGTAAGIRPPSPTGRCLSLALAALLLFGAAIGSAWAHNGGRGGHAHTRHSGGHRAGAAVILAVPSYWFFPDPIFRLPLVAEPAAAPVYIEQGDAQPAAGQAAGDLWYYCADSGAYYPYVKECASEWQRVAAQPPAGQ